MGFAAGRYFVKEVFGGKSRAKGTKVITGKQHLSALGTLVTYRMDVDIIHTFKNSLKHIKWMDVQSADAAAEKVTVVW